MISSLSSLSAFCLFPPRNKKPKTLISSLLSSPKPRSNRKNHLRPKLPPKPSTPKLIPLENPNFFLPVEEEEEEQQQEQAIEIEIEAGEVEESVQELTYDSQSVEPLPNPNPSTSSLILDLSFRLAALLAVQTAAAVWLFSSAGGLKHEEARHEESTNFDARVVDKESTEKEKGKELTDFERVVLEIREMAKGARETEAKKREENEIEYERLLKGNLNAKDSGNEKLGPMKRLEFVKSNVMRRKNVGKGFNGMKKMEDGAHAGDNGGIQQIAHQNSITDSLNLPESRQSTPGLSELTDKPADVEASFVLPYGKFPYVGSMWTSRRTVEGPTNDNRTSLLNPNSTRRGTQIKQNLKEEEHPSSTESSDVNGISGSRLKNKKAIKNSTVNKYKDDIFDNGKRPWWLKLPFVTAILLRRGSDGSSAKGLYSLKICSPSDYGGSASYTIVFQDQGDATNFCYLLETFFEELDDFSADVVPLTIGELEEGVRTGVLKVIVVRKGQLQLYAGQPLVEVETALRSLLD